jgi:hypothetical protein
MTDQAGKEEKVNAMSWKKMLKSLLVRNPKFNGSITYSNKKGNAQVRIFREGRRQENGEKGKR